MATDEEIERRGFTKRAPGIWQKNGTFYAVLQGEMRRLDQLTYGQMQEAGINPRDAENYCRLMKDTERAKAQQQGQGLPHEQMNRALKEEAPKEMPTSTPQREKPSTPPPARGSDDEAKQITEVVEEREAFAIMERQDEDQIEAEIKGRFLEAFIYSFPQKGGGMVTGLSWAGVKEVARRMGHISIVDLAISVNEDGTTYRVLAKAKDLQTDVEMYGVSEQSKVQVFRNGETGTDQFALQKAVSKAQRNAIRSLIPEGLIKVMIEEYLAKMKGGK